jgi:DNA-binding NarL/FixJ family response regulator
MDALLKVLIADDHPLMLQGIRRALEAGEGIDVVGEARSGEEVLALVARRNPDLVLLDLHMPGLGGLACVQEIKRGWPDVKSVVISAFDDQASIDSALLAGASAYILKSVSPMDIASVLRQAWAGAVYHIPSAPTPYPAESSAACGPDLTPRETTILTAVAQGRTTKANDQGDQPGPLAERAHGQVSSHQHLPQARRSQPRRSDPLRIRERSRFQ